jgi:hypothetical protein
MHVNGSSTAIYSDLIKWGFNFSYFETNKALYSISNNVEGKNGK